jgi:response regulator RpfG family c-di-GMP phosphodiesterase
MRAKGKLRMVSENHEESKVDLKLQQQLLKYASDVSRLYKNLKKENTLLKKANRELVENYYQTVLMGFDLIAMRDEFLGGHCRRVSQYAGDLSEALGLGQKAKANVKLAALLHDVGLIGIPHKTLLNILTGKEPSKENIDIYRAHPDVEVRPITSTERFKDIAKMIRAHHENMDGTGFPNNLKGKEIPIGSRIISVADDYDLKKQLSQEPVVPRKILEDMEQEVESKYDEKVFFPFMLMILTNDPFHRIVNARLDQLTAGSVLAEPIASESGVKLLGADTVLNDAQIERIRRFAGHLKLIQPVKVYRPSL